MFSDDMCSGKHTYQPAGVPVGRAQSGCKPTHKESPVKPGLFLVLNAKSGPIRAAFCITAEKEEIWKSI